MGCHEWWGSRRETQLPAQQHQSPVSHKVCGNKQVTGKKDDAFK